MAIGVGFRWGGGAKSGLIEVAAKSGLIEVVGRPDTLGKSVGFPILARLFPTTFILDRNGIVLFAQNGPVADWLVLEPLLKDAARAKAEQIEFSGNTPQTIDL